MNTIFTLDQSELKHKIFNHKAPVMAVIGFLNGCCSLINAAQDNQEYADEGMLPIKGPFSVSASFAPIEQEIQASTAIEELEELDMRALSLKPDVDYTALSTQEFGTYFETLIADKEALTEDIKRYFIQNYLTTVLYDYDDDDKIYDDKLSPPIREYLKKMPEEVFDSSFDKYIHEIQNPRHQNRVWDYHIDLTLELKREREAVEKKANALTFEQKREKELREIEKFYKSFKLTSLQTELIDGKHHVVSGTIAHEGILPVKGPCSISSSFAPIEEQTVQTQASTAIESVDYTALSTQEFGTYFETLIADTEALTEDIKRHFIQAYMVECLKDDQISEVIHNKKISPPIREYLKNLDKTNFKKLFNK